MNPDESAASSQASSTPNGSGSPFVSDPGPGFDAAAAAAGAQDARDQEHAEQRAELFELPPVAEESIRDFLRNGGDALHAVIGVGEHDWRATQADLARIAPPATRIINRYQLSRAIASYSDEAALLTGVVLYSWRSMLERQAYLNGYQPPASQEERQAPPPAPGHEPAPAAPARAPAQPAAAPRQQEPSPPPVTVAAGYMTYAERLRQARERSANAKPGEGPEVPR